tara:strand:- start:362 stop:619 length:258 start_codon:yes stop_codon:yes gene_type:complete
MPENILPVPFFYNLFKRPGPKMVQYLDKVRVKLDLPMLEDGIEEYPGQWGLRTPGYYLFALHFRNIPVGFEPLAIDLNQVSLSLI